MSTPRRLWATLLTSSILGLAGCITINDADTAQPQPSVSTVVVTAEASSPAAETSSPSAAPTQTSEPEQAPATASQVAPVGVAPGTSCGSSNTGASTLVVAENSANLNCDQVQSIFADFNATFTSGDTSNYQIQGFTCHTRSLADVEREGRSVTCTQGGTRLEAMTVYPLGGVPVQNQATFTVQGSGNTMAWFATDFGYCSLSEADDQVVCARTGSNVRETPILMTASQAPHHMVTGGSYPNGDPIPLPQGQVLTHFGSSCLNEGHQIRCNNGTYSFTISASGDSVH